MTGTKGSVPATGLPPLPCQVAGDPSCLYVIRAGNSPGTPVFQRLVPKELIAPPVVFIPLTRL